MSDIRLQTQKDGEVSVTLSDRFSSLPLYDQVQELEAFLGQYRGKRSSWYETSSDESPDGLETRLMESLLSAIEDGIKIKKITWKIDGATQDLLHDELKEYWLRNSC